MDGLLKQTIPNGTWLIIALTFGDSPNPDTGKQLGGRSDTILNTLRWMSIAILNINVDLSCRTI